jgi:uncharacterized protein (TIGR02246 family)
MKTITTPQKSSISTADHKAIDELFDKLSDAWACGDGEAYASLFIRDAVFVGVFGFRLNGREIIRQRHQEMFNGIFKFSRLDSMIGKQIQPLTPEVVLVNSDGDVYFPGETPQMVKASGLRTLTVVKVQGEWRIALFQNTPTGSFRHLKFMWRFLKSRLYLSHSGWKQAYMKVLEAKQQNINLWRLM